MSRMSTSRCQSCGVLNAGPHCWNCGHPNAHLARRDAERKMDDILNSAVADDDEPITREWVKQEYGTGEIDVTEDIGIAVSVNGGVVIELFSGRYYAQAPLSHIHTRGELRQLLTALGWRREG